MCSPSSYFIASSSAGMSLRSTRKAKFLDGFADSPKTLASTRNLTACRRFGPNRNEEALMRTGQHPIDPTIIRRYRTTPEPVFTAVERSISNSWPASMLSCLCISAGKTIWPLDETVVFIEDTSYVPLNPRKLRPYLMTIREIGETRTGGDPTEYVADQITENLTQDQQGAEGSLECRVLPEHPSRRSST
jgi:hypothetical protein